MSRKILHVDLDAFFCAVEEQQTPSLKGRPFAVGGRPEDRGVVASCSYAARRFGVRSAMPMSMALRLCPELVVISHHRGRYREASQQVMARLHDLTPLVEQLSIDEAFLDVTMRPEAAAAIAGSLQAAINRELDLPCSLGVATNKLVAKIANNVGKASAVGDGPPNAITIVPPGEEGSFLAPLPVGELWGVGPKTAQRLAGEGIHTIGDLALLSEPELVRRFGKHGASLYRHARGLDDRAVETTHETKSISKETTFSKDVRARSELMLVLRTLADGVGRQLRGEGLAATTVRIKLRWSDFTTLTRQKTLDMPVVDDDDIYHTAVQLLETHWPPGRPVRLIGVGVSGFVTPYRQLGLWEDRATREDQQRLQQTLDDLRDRFGDDAVMRGSQLKPDSD